MSLTRRNFMIAMAAGAVLPLVAMAEETRDIAKVKLPPLKKGGEPVEYSFKDWVDKDGKALLASDIDGKLLLIYGGYLECTGVCPGAAGNLVAAMKNLKKDDPEMAKKVSVIVVMIKKSKDDETLDEAKARAKKWQAEGLQGDETGIRVLVSDQQKVLDDFMDKFGNKFKNESGVLIHSPWAYMFNGSFIGLAQTQKGPEPILEKIKAHFNTTKPAPEEPAP